ncbi:MAG: Fe-S cluster assembly protein SufD [Bacteroidales bacterium]|nr:Fe-S cluster assembly protein SufD [Bacteroidales bacterium]
METIIQQILGLRQQLNKNEVWRDVDFSPFLANDMRLPLPDEASTYCLHCNIPNLDTYSVIIENGHCRQPLTTTPEGIIMGSLRQALKEHPELVGKALSQCEGTNDYCRLNHEHYSDGAFIYVPQQCTAAKPIQLLSIHSSNDPLILQTRNVVVLGNDSHTTLIHCDDSTNQQRFFANNVTEIMVGRNARLEHYKMQNINDQTGLLNHTYVIMHEASELRSVVLTLNGGHIRNHCEVRMAGQHCHTEVHGLYLNDRSQQADNYVFIDHQQPNCTSHELFKGILDDSAHASFNGHVMVREGATKTEAYMTNRNILLTDKATIYTKPFLEIYNDDVKCSHGSTIGQMDDDAMFYLRSRGITERSARTLLLYAFCDEVVAKIALEPLRQRLSDMIKQRLHGELTVCSDCALGCTSPCGCADSHFEIDASKL